MMTIPSQLLILFKSDEESAILPQNNHKNKHNSHADPKHQHKLTEGPHPRLPKQQEDLQGA